ncbi:hypothetical protein N0B28_13855 [Pseudomonas sp. SD17-1]|uniref:hypothetical protein n=1 Tax=Pseudomonas sp. SD17-1 TaxID=2976883 RepID=UPI0023DC3B17|nr:hypothetical protein [Pseudomonas sp. SD17-1]WEJ19385.1 hypothetical protein N0B28_13855 [Pseudomonas sp. SD17-1]
MKHHTSSRFSALALACWLMAGLAFQASGALADQLIGTHPSAAGPINHMETPQGHAYLTLPQRKLQLQLPAQWRETNVEGTYDLQGETAVVLSYRTPQCDSQSALVVLSGTSAWGPYRLGGCSDMLALQRAEDGKSLVAMQLNGTQSAAWTYSSLDRQFRGPLRVDLPNLLKGLARATPAPARAAALRPAPVQHAVAPTPPPQPRPAPAVARVEAKPPTPAPAAAPSAAPQVTPQVATEVVDRAKTAAPAQRRVTLDLTSELEH